MSTANLTRRGHKWYARAIIPIPLRPLVGKEEVLRALGTGDLKEANARKHAALAAIHKDWAALAGPPPHPPRPPHLPQRSPNRPARCSRRSPPGA